MSIKKMIFSLEAILAVAFCCACGAEKVTVDEEIEVVKPAAIQKATVEEEENASTYDFTGQLVLGAQYLEEIRYEEAFAVYKGLLQMVNEDADAYLGIVEVYIRQGEYDTALEYAQKGYEVTGDDRLLTMVEMIKSGNIVDSKNRRLRETVYDDNGKIRWWYQYTYDKNGRIDIVSHHSADGTILGQVQCQYDEDGNQLVAWSDDLETGQLYRDVCEYENELCVKEERYTLQSKLDISWTFQYNEKGLCVQKNQYAGNGALELVYKSEYDESGKRIQEKLYSPEGTLYTYRIYEYDQMGNCIKESDYNANGQLQECWIYEYDADGKCVSVNIYDGNGRLIQETKND